MPRFTHKVTDYCGGDLAHGSHYFRSLEDEKWFCAGVWMEEDDVTDEPEDVVNHPKHYTSHPSGIECIEITRHMGFNLGNVVKYIWRDGIKDADTPIQDLKKALWYLQDEITQREKNGNS